jgi:hypothetical protein
LEKQGEIDRLEADRRLLAAREEEARAEREKEQAEFLERQVCPQPLKYPASIKLLSTRRYLSNETTLLFVMF